MVTHETGSGCVRATTIDRRGLLGALLLLLAGTLAATVSQAAERATVLEIPLSDGIESHAWWYSPSTGAEGAGRGPVVLVRTPYGDSDRTAEVAAHRLQVDDYLAEGWHVVVQHVRGTGRSREHTDFRFLFQEEADGNAAVRWLQQQPFSDGRVVMTGASYAASTQWAAAAGDPPGLSCIAPAATFAGAPFSGVPYVGGALQLSWALEWIPNIENGVAVSAQQVLQASQRRPLLRADVAFGGPLRWWRLVHSHPTPDEFWQPLLETWERAARFSGTTLTTTGWYDGDLNGSLQRWRARARQVPASSNQLLIGPWTHLETWVGGGDADAILDPREERLRFLSRCLAGNEPTSVPPVRVFVTGAERWLSGDDYPPLPGREVAFHLQSGGSANTASGDGRLIDASVVRPGADQPRPSSPRTAVADRYLYDPRDPAPTVVARVDRRERQNRDDVLVYTSDVLGENLTILGPARAVVHVAVDAPDTDLVVRLAEVLADGRSVGLHHTMGVQRLRYREGPNRAVFLEPDEIVEVTIPLGDFGHTFRKGHRIRLEVTSSDFPYIDANPNTGGTISLETRVRPARVLVYHSANRPSRLVLPVVEPARN